MSPCPPMDLRPYVSVFRINLNDLVTVVVVVVVAAAAAAAAVVVVVVVDGRQSLIKVNLLNTVHSGFWRSRC